MEYVGVVVQVFLSYGQNQWFGKNSHRLPYKASGCPHFGALVNRKKMQSTRSQRSETIASEALDSVWNIIIDARTYAPVLKLGSSLLNYSSYYHSNWNIISRPPCPTTVPRGKESARRVNKYSMILANETRFPPCVPFCRLCVQLFTQHFFSERTPTQIPCHY